MVFFLVFLLIEVILAQVEDDAISWLLSTRKNCVATHFFLFITVQVLEMCIKLGLLDLNFHREWFLFDSTLPHLLHWIHYSSCQFLQVSVLSVSLYSVKHGMMVLSTVFYSPHFIQTIVLYDVIL